VLGWDLQAGAHAVLLLTGWSAAGLLRLMAQHICSGVVQLSVQASTCVLDLAIVQMLAIEKTERRKH
jgi:TM2 domain-containing membrane protein YozV